MVKHITEDFLEAAKGVSSLEALNDLFAKTLKKIGLTEWGYQLIQAEPNKKMDPFIVSNFPEDWVNHYVESGYTQVDPTILEGPKQVIPFNWTSMYLGESSSIRKKFISEAEDYRLGEGIGIPMHGIGGTLAMVSMTTRDESAMELAKLLDEYRDKIHVISLVYHSIAKDLVSVTRNQANIMLTDREKECLKWLALGKTSMEVAQILHITERTVNFHIENAKHKLGVTSRQYAVVKAIMHNYITL
jgi:LuxR family transcriptional activator of conjugal transfer of Ti plasmids